MCLQVEVCEHVFKYVSYIQYRYTSRKLRLNSIDSGVLGACLVLAARSFSAMPAACDADDSSVCERLGLGETSWSDFMTYGASGFSPWAIVFWEICGWVFFPVSTPRSSRTLGQRFGREELGLCGVRFLLLFSFSRKFFVGNVLPSMVVFGSRKRWAWWHIIPHLAGIIYHLLYIPLIVLALWGGYMLPVDQLTRIRRSSGS